MTTEQSKNEYFLGKHNIESEIIRKVRLKNNLIDSNNFLWNYGVTPTVTQCIIQLEIIFLEKTVATLDFTRVDLEDSWKVVEGNVKTKICQFSLQISRELETRRGHSFAGL